MIELLRATKEDLSAVGSNAMETLSRPYFDGQIDLSPVIDSPYAWAARYHGVPLFAGGLVDCGAGAGLAWALIGSVPRHLAVPFCRLYRRVLEENPFLWLEALVDQEFAVSLRWVGLLGFERLKDAPPLLAPSGREYLRFVYCRGRAGND